MSVLYSAELFGRYAFYLLFFFFNDTATTEIYTLSLHDALPISSAAGSPATLIFSTPKPSATRVRALATVSGVRSEEHTSELQSQFHLVCRLLLEKKKKNKHKNNPPA